MFLKTITKKLFPKSFLNFRHFFYAWYGAFKYKRPSEELLVIGVTGTSGKSTTCYLLRQLLESAGFIVGALSTIEFYVAGEQKLNDRKMTMLGKMEIQKYLRKMADKKCDIAIIETTSEGRLQHRHRFINYDMMILTNLYPEHIESHGSYAKYRQAKKDIFEYVSKLPRKKKIGRLKDWKIKDYAFIPKITAVNVDCKFADEFLNFSFDEKIIFGKNLQSFVANNISVDKAGLHFEVDGNKIHAPMYGEHNVMNLLAAFAVLRSLNVDWEIIKQACAKLTNVPGRIEFIPEAEKQGFQVIVDYAFEPGAMKGLYEVVELLKPNKIIHVFGATGGGRDREKRKVLSQFIARRADYCIVTNEDPYDDDPMEIINDVASGALESGKVGNQNLFKILDRREAIEKAVSLAKEGDIVLITGKGSEQAIAVKNGKLMPWDDRKVVREVLENK